VTDNRPFIIPNNRDGKQDAARSRSLYRRDVYLSLHRTRHLRQCKLSLRSN